MNETVALTRRVTFSAGHRYWNPDLSAEENKSLFGPWASPFNHGHNYVLEVTCSGQVSESHGMVVNIKVIDEILKRHVLEKLDLKSLNDEVAAFQNKAPSLENLVLFLRAEINDKLPREVTLTHLRLQETPTLWADFRMNPEQITLTRQYEFAASHRLHVPELSHEENIQLFGKCNNPRGHGHNYLLEVTVTGIPDPKTGMMLDLGKLDEEVHRAVVDRYDHKNLNEDLPEFAGRNTTSEVVALQIFETLQQSLSTKLVKVRLHETARNIFEVCAE